jgi:ATP-dependent Clp protease ATP-binding subunit ClpB
VQAKRERLREDAQVARQKGDLVRTADIVHGAIPELDARLKQLRADLPENPMLSEKIGVEEIATVVSRWTGVPVSRLRKTEVEKLVGLQEELHKRVVGQDSAVAAVADAVLRSRAGISATERGSSFLFLGPTGVPLLVMIWCLAFSASRHARSCMHVWVWRDRVGDHAYLLSCA